MAIDTGNIEINEQIQRLLKELAQQNTNALLLNTKARIRESAFHDFSNYQFILDPLLLRFPEIAGLSGSGREDGRNVPIGTWIEFDEFVNEFGTEIIGAVQDWSLTENWEFDADSVGYSNLTTEKELVVEQVSINGKLGFRLGMAPSLFVIYIGLIDSMNSMESQTAKHHAKLRVNNYLALATRLVSEFFEKRLDLLHGGDGVFKQSVLNVVRLGSFWSVGLSEILPQLADYEVNINNDPDRDELLLHESYNFEPFLPGSFNFGFQSIYRQAWIPLGTQAGEIVRTLPLGPKQVEKITVKAIRRTKATRQSEIVTSIETSTESSAATKDSSEVMEAASESSNWHVEASADSNWGWGSASVSGNMGGENSSSSSDTKTRLNETMEKTASRMKSETKIVVSTETENTDEFSQVSTIENINDANAVTYIYSRLQRQYELRTYLSEVNSVVFIAEKIPSPRQIDGAWIRRYDWIISKVLLDNSFKSDLEIIRNFEQINYQESVDSNIERLMESISGESTTGIPDYSKLRGKLPDIFSNQQEAYEREVERSRARDSNRRNYRSALHRMQIHIYDNILHYCRAIWSEEDQDARLLRYRAIKIPSRWEILGGGNSNSQIDAHIVPKVSDENRDTVPLSELINPAGPIGFAGNYSIYFIKESARWESLSNIISLSETPFLECEVNIESAVANSVTGIASDNRFGPGDYRLTILSSDVQIVVIEEESPQGIFNLVRETPLSEIGQINFHSIKLTFNDPASIPNQSQFNVSVRIKPILEDPELKAIRWNDISGSGVKDSSHFPLSTIQEMREYFTEVADLLVAYDSTISFDDLNESEKNVIRSFYYEHLLRKKHSRKILIDTNNVMLNIETDDNKTLEPYKELHRLLDVLKTGEELNEARIENLRKQKRIDKDLLGDPDVDKVTVVSGNSDLAGFAALDGITPDE